MTWAAAFTRFWQNSF